MNLSMFEVGATMVMVVVIVALIIWIRNYKEAGSKRRMMRMLKRVGLDPEIATIGDREAVMREVRRRCRRCPSESLCERWLDGEEEGANEFCPNARVFEFLKRADESTVQR